MQVCTAKWIASFKFRTKEYFIKFEVNPCSHLGDHALPIPIYCYFKFKGTVQQLNFGLFEKFFFGLIYLSSSGEHISFRYIPCFGPPNKSYSRVYVRILWWKHNQPKIKSFLTLQPHWKHSGQQTFLYGLLAIIEIRHVFFKIHLFQFLKCYSLK